MLAFGEELHDIAAEDGCNAPVKGVIEALHTQRFQPCEHVRDFEAKQLFGLFCVKVHHTAGKKRQAKCCEGLGNKKVHKHVVVTQAL